MPMNDKTDMQKGRYIKLFSSFDREWRVGKYRVNRMNENIVDAINERLLGIDEFIKQEVDGRHYPSIIITGVPRSGTTLVSQLLPARYDLGYVSNLMARFYASPLTGAWFQQQLIPKDIHSLRSFSSHHGVTDHIYEPHEFGYFWSRYLSFDSNCHEPNSEEQLKNIDFEGLNSVLSSISMVFGRAVIYKCAISPFVIDSFLKNTNTFFVHVTRDRKSTINSILNVRLQRLGNKNKWWSIRPCGWDKMLEKSSEEQIAWQYDKVINSVRGSYSKYGDRIIEISLEKLCASPEVELEKAMASFYKYSKHGVSKVGSPIQPLVGAKLT